MSKDKLKPCPTMRTKGEIKKAIKEIEEHKSLRYSYKEDVLDILKWVLGGDDFDGIGEQHD